jgi:hypothetical protein
VFGEPPNIAARVQSAAEPGSIVITATVQRQTAGLFVVEDRGQHALKGVSAPVTLYRVVRASGGGRRGGARVLTPLVGREEEFDLLSRRWERARKGEGQLALVMGEPGLGKSRLVEEFHGHLGETPHTWVEWSSTQLLQNTPLHPIAEWGRQRFGADLPAEQRLADLENTLDLIGLDPTEYAPLLAPIVDIPGPQGSAARLPPEELRRPPTGGDDIMDSGGRADASDRARLRGPALGRPDFTRSHARVGRAWGAGAVVHYRNDAAGVPFALECEAAPQRHYVQPFRSRRRRADGRRLAPRHALSRQVVEGVSKRSGGVPLFVEEVTRLLLERGEAGGLHAIPPTLQQSLAARLDRLGEAREVAQIGAVLGRDFTSALISAVGEIGDPALQSALDRLAGADLLIAEGAGADAIYRFKHALIQDAAYDSLLTSRGQALHGRAAELLRDQPERRSRARSDCPSFH